MSTALQYLISETRFFPYFAIFFLCFTRFLVVFTLIPFVGGQSVPGRIRVAVSMVFAAYLSYILAPGLLDIVPTDFMTLFGLFAKELLFAYVIGFVTMAIFRAFEAAGAIVDNQRGSANAMLFLPQLGQVSIFGLFNFWLAIALFLSIGGHRMFMEAFILSFDAVPLLAFPNFGSGYSPFIELIVRLSGDVLVIATQLAAPVLIAILLVDLVLGLANKMAPQINVFELGFAVKGYMGPLMIYISLIVLLSQMRYFTDEMIKMIYRLQSILS